jgi:ubiquitin carboxyl-terminal hydrolase 10
MHLKRFRYEDNQIGTKKIRKKVGFPLELENPKEAFPSSSRDGIPLKSGAEISSYLCGLPPRRV